MPGLVVRPDTAACAEPFMHGCMLAVDGGEHARAPPSDSAGVLAGAAHSVRAAVAPLLPGAGTAVWVAVGAGLLALELSWLADVLGPRDATQPALLAGTSRDVKARVATSAKRAELTGAAGGGGCFAGAGLVRRRRAAAAGSMCARRLGRLRPGGRRQRPGVVCAAA